MNAVFGGALALDGYELDGDTLQLHWRCLNTPALDVTVFVHGFDATGALAAQSDAPASFPTSLCDTGDVFVETRNVAGLAGVDDIRVGVYEPGTNERWPAQRADGTEWPDRLVTLVQR